MRRRSKLLLGGFVAMLALAVAINTASAHRFEFSSESIKAIAAEVTMTGQGNLFIVRCGVGIQGVFHSRTIAKVSGQLIGLLTSGVASRPCVGGEAWILNGVEVLEGVTTANTLPWHIQYNSFTGTLPRINGIRVAVIGFSVLVRATILGVPTECLYRSTQASPLFAIIMLNAETGVATNWTYEGATSIPKNAGVAACPATVRVAGVALFSTPAGVSITVRLVA